MGGGTSNDDILCQGQNTESVWEEGIEVVAFGFPGLHLNCVGVAMFRVQTPFGLLEMSDGAGTRVSGCKSLLHVYNHSASRYSPLME